MAKLTLGQKAHRVLQFIVGVRHKRVASALAAHGFGNEDLDEGWDLLRALTRGRVDTVQYVADPGLIVALDRWENKWFPIVSSVLENRFPAVQATVFRNLYQAEGNEVIVVVNTLLSRLDALPTTGDGAGARAILVKRGFTAEVVGEARALLAKLGKIDDTPDDSGGVDAAEEAAREKRLWAWYLEWSAIARSSITNRRALRALGFLNDRGEPIDDDDAPPEEEEAEPPPPAPEPVVAAPGNNGSPASPNLPGGDPFAGSR